MENAQQPIPGVDVLALGIVYDVDEAERDRLFRAALTGEIPLRVDAVIWEPILRQLVDGPTVMRAQLERLTELAAQPNITLRVLPLGIGAYPAMGSSFEMLSFAEEHYADVVYVENLGKGSYLEEESEVEAYTVHFEGLCETALDPDASAGLIREIIAELTV